LNILLANASWYPSGGDWTYVNSIKNIYENNGHNIIPFAMMNNNNFPTQYDKWFIKHVDYKELNKNKSISNSVKVLAQSIYSFESKKKLKSLLEVVSIDIAQLNNISNVHTPSIIDVLKKANIPIVWRVLDYKLICPNRTFLSHGKICESCLKHKYYQCVLKKCKKDSILASTIAAMDNYFYYLSPHYRHVSMFLFQSEFTRDMFVKYGFDREKTCIIENPYETNDINPCFNGKNYILYFGRLSNEKGIVTLLKAMVDLPNIALKIVGDGPEYSNYVNYTKKHNIKNVSFLGPKWNEELEPIIKDCEFVVLPSEWYDPNPLVVLQAYSYGKPVVASDIGGLSDMIIHNSTGLLFKAKDKLELIKNIDYLYKNKDMISGMGRNARSIVEKKYNPENYYRKTNNLFSSLINGYNI